MSRWILIIIVGLLFSCSDNSRTKGTVITGKVNYPGSGHIYLELLTPKGFESIDSAKADANGSFQLQTQSLNDQICRINFYNLQKNVVVLGGPSIELVADGNAKEGKFIADGNIEVEDLSRIIELGRTHERQQGILNDAFSSSDDQSMLDSLTQLKQQNESAYLTEVTNLVRKHKGKLAGLFMLNEYVDIESNLDLYEEFMPTFQDALADHWYFSKSFETYENIRRLAVGAFAPDFELPDPEGNPVALSLLKGKFVYLDFWASWCQPCRRDNPYLVKVYDKYKDENFEILGISFDRRRDRWLDAIEKDQLGWIHVSDLKYFDSKMIQLYQITNVPTTFLLDPEGRIVAKNLHYSELDQMLAELL